VRLGSHLVQLKFLGNLHSTCQRPRTVCFTRSGLLYAMMAPRASGLSDLDTAVRLRYEISRKFAPEPDFQNRSRSPNTKWWPLLANPMYGLCSPQSSSEDFLEGANHRCSDPPTPGLSAIRKESLANERSKRERADEMSEAQKADQFFSNTCEIVGRLRVYTKELTLSLSYSIPGERCVIEFCNTCALWSL
jgi:hypothetical protein